MQILYSNTVFKIYSAELSHIPHQMLVTTSLISILDKHMYTLALASLVTFLNDLLRSFSREKGTDSVSHNRRALSN